MQDICVARGYKDRGCSIRRGQDKIDDALVPYRWYYDLVLSGAEEHGLPIDYVAGLRAIPFTHDPKPDRKERLEALEVLRSD